MTTQTNLNNAKDLNSLLTQLNNTLCENDCSNIELSDLPTWGNEPKKTTAIYSWDDENVIFFNDYQYVLMNRCPECGEAAIYCTCDEAFAID